LGTAILITDQTVTPVMADLLISKSGSRIDRFRIRVGEPGSGFLGISGPPCNSSAAWRLFYMLENRVELGEIDWVYDMQRK
jgi:hypothetical protein